MPEDRLTTRQAGEILGVNDSRVRQFLQSGDLEGVKFGHVWSIDRKSVERLLQRRQKKSSS